jgi:Gpi18-like mannosyltransferase
MKQSCLTNTQEHVNDWIASGSAFAMTKRSFTRLLVNLFTHLRMKNLYTNIIDRFPFLQKTGFWIALIFAGMLLKLILFPFANGDYCGFWLPWINFIKEHAYFSSLQYHFYSSNLPSYVYILILIAKTGLNPLYLIKGVSVLFEYLLAFFIGKTIGLKYNNKQFIWISLAIIPLIPTVLINSAYFAQYDAIYASFAVGSIYFLLKKQTWISVLFFALACVVKMQTFLLLPFFFVMMLRKHIRLYHFLIVVPAVYFLSILPAFLMGGSLERLFTIYITQTDHYKHLTMNFPNLYIWISDDYYETVKYIGLVVTFLITLVTGILLSRKKYEFTFDHCIQFAFLCAITTPFLLPGMHERYMYLGDVLGVLYFFIARKQIGFPAGIILISFYSYIRCSRFNDILPQSPAFFLYLFILAGMIWNFKQSLKKTQALCS